MKGPHIDWAAISPLVALTVGALPRADGGAAAAARSCARTLVPALTIVTLGVADRARRLAVGREPARDRPGALAIDDLTLALLMIFAAGAIAATLLSARSLAAAEAGHGEYYALLLVVGARDGRARGRDEPGDAVHRLRAAVDPALRAVRDRAAARALARVGPEVPDHRLARLGGAALRPGAALRRDGLDRLRDDRRRGRRRQGRRAVPDRARADRRPGWRSRRRWRRSTSGRPTSTRARRRRSPRSWRWRPRRPRSAC